MTPLLLESPSAAAGELAQGYLLLLRWEIGGPLLLLGAFSASWLPLRLIESRLRQVRGEDSPMSGLPGVGPMIFLLGWWLSPLAWSTWALVIFLVDVHVLLLAVFGLVLGIRRVVLGPGDAKGQDRAMDASLRPYTESDWLAVCAVHDAARPLELDRGGVDPVAAMRPMTEVAERDGFHDSESLVAEVDGVVVGFVSWWDDYVTWLYVHPDHEGRGIGRALATAAVERIGDQAWSMALATNGPSVGLFGSLGLGVVKRFRGDCEGIPCDSVRLALATSRMADPKATEE